MFLMILNQHTPTQRQQLRWVSLLRLTHWGCEHTILTAEEIISCHQKYGTNTGGITEDLWSSFSPKFTTAELMKNRLSICQPWAGSQTQNLTVRMKYCVKYSGADAPPRSGLVFTLGLPPCSLSHFQPDVSLSSLCPPSISFCSILSLQCCRELLSFNLATDFTKKKSKKRWGQSRKVETIKMAERTSLSWNSWFVVSSEFLYIRSKLK